MSKIRKTKIDMLAKGEVFTNNATGNTITSNDIISSNSNSEFVVNNKLFIKLFYMYNKENMGRTSFVDRGFLLSRISYGIGDGNKLSQEYIKDVKQEYDKGTIFDYIKRLIEANYVKRLGRGEYVLNPRFAIVGTGIKKNVRDMFDDRRDIENGVNRIIQEIHDKDNNL